MLRLPTLLAVLLGLVSTADVLHGQSFLRVQELLVTPIPFPQGAREVQFTLESQFARRLSVRPDVSLAAEYGLSGRWQVESEIDWLPVGAGRGYRVEELSVGVQRSSWKATDPDAMWAVGASTSRQLADDEDAPDGARSTSRSTLSVHSTVSRRAPALASLLVVGVQSEVMVGDLHTGTLAMTASSITPVGAAFVSLESIWTYTRTDEARIRALVVGSSVVAPLLGSLQLAIGASSTVRSGTGTLSFTGKLTYEF